MPRSVAYRGVRARYFADEVHPVLFSRIGEILEELVA
jgi:hypothetical protein